MEGGWQVLKFVGLLKEYKINSKSAKLQIASRGTANADGLSLHGRGGYSIANVFGSF